MTDRMSNGGELHVDDALWSAGGFCRLVLQTDGNLVLYRQDTGRALWFTATGLPTSRVAMQSDGNLVCYDAAGNHYWDSGTAGHPNATLILQDDYNLVIYDATGAIWDSHTSGGALAASPIWRQQLQSMNGWAQVQIYIDGTVRFSGHVHNDALLSEAFDFAVRVVVGGAHAFAIQESGHCGGFGATDSGRNHYWDYTLQRVEVSRYFDRITSEGKSRFYEAKSGTVTGALEDVLDFAVGWIIGEVVIGPLGGALIFVGTELLSLATTGSAVPGAQIIAGTLWLKGPSGTLYAIVAAGVAALGQSSRQISDDEYEWAKSQVFEDSLPPRDKLIITDTVGGGGRPFTFPRVDGSIGLNLGPVYYNSHVKDGLLIHELTHAWQIQHASLGVSWLADAFATQICYGLTGGGYNPGPAGPPFSAFNLEQQATIVERWYGGGRHSDDPYYRYIEGNIRLGVS